MEFFATFAFEQILQRLDQDYGDSGFSSRVKNLNQTLASIVEKNGDSGLIVGHLNDFKKFLEDLQSKLFHNNFRREDLNAFNQRINNMMYDIQFFIQLNTMRDVKTVADVTRELSSVAPMQELKIFDFPHLRMGDTIITDHESSKICKGTYNGRIVAVKMKKTLQTLTKHSEENFTREALILQMLNSRQIPGVVGFLGVDNAVNPTAIVMEYGQCNLHEYLLSHSGCTLVDRLEILLRCCETFVRLIDQKVLHRDIKPENVLIMHDNSVKIMNFGFVKSEEIGLSTGVTLRGTHSFVAPELLMTTSGPYQYSEATDMYSFAVMMNGVLTGVYPFIQQTQTQLIGAMFRTNGNYRPPIITEGAYIGYEGVCAGLSAVIGMCWNVFPKIRLSFTRLEEQLRELVVKAQETEDTLRRSAIAAGQRP